MEIVEDPRGDAEQMQLRWEPGFFARLFSSAARWILTIEDDAFVFDAPGVHMEGSVVLLDDLVAELGGFWSTITLVSPFSGTLRLTGLPNNEASDLVRALEAGIRRARARTFIEDNLDEVIAPIVGWAMAFQEAARIQLSTKGWITADFKAAQAALGKPGLACPFLHEPEVLERLEAQPAEIRDAVRLWREETEAALERLNERHLAQELTRFRPLFDNVEKSPLTEEQARSVVCFDTRVLVVAAAGSGKTSTMVAKAAYALTKGYVKAESILLLAFNKDAALELEERVKARLSPLGLPAQKIAAMTFHAFALEIIGQASGRKPSVAPWLENGQDLVALLEVVEVIRVHDSTFRANWDLLSVVLDTDLPQFGEERGTPDAWDEGKGREGFWTLNAEIVKSKGEQVLANWLFYNGIRYEYERPYPVDTATAEHAQYCPDFFFPDIDTYLEHWALDERGDPPASFKGYMEGIEWKRALHLKHRTPLLETTMAGLWSGAAFTYLERELTSRGLRLDPDPKRPPKGRRTVENPRIAKTCLAFLSHFKSNRLTVGGLRAKLRTQPARLHFRHSLFLDVFEKIEEAWNARLALGGYVDFDDMLNAAVDCVAEGRWQSPFRLVMVDEFQDVSQARARLVGALTRKPDHYLFAVGDDWQSINRFAGSDIAIMTGFEQRFGKATIFKLQTTFRCPQSLCDISSAFVQRNPWQLRKEVVSARPDVESPVRIIQVERESLIKAAVASRIQELARSSAGKPLRIYLLGRYNREAEYLPTAYDRRRIDLQFITAHSSKGLEADHVILPRVTSEVMGFPGRIDDDPVLQLAMPGAEAFRDAEERRLFYVALTRSRATVTLITLEHKQSSFVLELVRNHGLTIEAIGGRTVASKVCPECGCGLMIWRKRGRGFFSGCSRFPECQYINRSSS